MITWQCYIKGLTAQQRSEAKGADYCDPQSRDPVRGHLQSQGCGRNEVIHVQVLGKGRSSRRRPSNVMKKSVSSICCLGGRTGERKFWRTGPELCSWRASTPGSSHFWKNEEWGSRSLPSSLPPSGPRTSRSTCPIQGHDGDAANCRVSAYTGITGAFVRGQRLTVASCSPRRDPGRQRCVVISQESC